MYARVLRMTVVTLGLAVAGLGCGEPQSAATQATTRPGNSVASRPALEGLYAAQPCDQPWMPGRGRLSDELAGRHGLAGTPIRKTGLGRTILWEDFSGAKGDGVPGWQQTGNPIVLVRADAARGRWVQLGAAKEAGRHRLWRSLSADEVAGQVVRLEAKILASTPRRSSGRDVPEVGLEWQNADGKQGTAYVAFPAYVSPGWETCQAYATVPAGAKDVKVVLSQGGEAAAADLDDVLVERIEPLVAAGAAGTREARQNLVDGGDFEVGQRNFSVYGARWIPGRRELRACPLAWSIDAEKEAAVGTRSLRIPLSEAEFRVAFGWVRVVPGRDYVVSLYARSNTKMALRIGVAEYPGVFRFEYFDVDEKFRRMALRVQASADLPWSALAVVVRPSDREKDAYTESPTNFLWLDGVSLTPEDPKETYVPPTPVEVGIVGPEFDPADIGHLVQVGTAVQLAVRVANYQPVAYEGRLAIDVVDAFDREMPGSSRVLKIAVAAGGSVEEKLAPMDLPRGYYRLLVSAWPKGVGQGHPYATAERAFAVVNLTDPIPTENYFGMTVEQPRMSRRITQMGAGWAWLRASREWCETSAGTLRWTWYKDLLATAATQRLEVLTCLDWADPAGNGPTQGDPWRKVCGEVATIGRGKVDGIGVLDQDALEGMTLSKYAVLLKQASEEIRRVALKTAVLASVSAGSEANQFAWVKRSKEMTGLVPSASGLVFRFNWTPLPEDIEPALEEIRSWRKTYPFTKYIDVGVGQRGPSGYLHVPNLYGYRDDDARARPDTPDPVLHASRLVRALAIRHFAMIDRAAWWVESHRPPDILRPTLDPQCHEYDNAPRPCLAAFDFMTEMLNPTALVEWIDLPQQARALCFEHAGGEMIVLIWRPFGWALSPIGLKGLAGKVAVYDLFGGREVHPIRGGDLLVMVNGIVRYLLVPSDVKDQVLQALREPLSVTTLPADSQPATAPASP